MRRMVRANGPAGSSAPLPKPRAPSMTAMVRSGHSARCCRPSSASTTVQPWPTSSCAASTRRAPMATGQPRRRAMSSASSPTSPASASAVTRRDPARIAPHTHAAPHRGRCPVARSCSASQITSGVLPVPPTVRLPTTMTGTPARCLRSQPRRVSTPPQRRDAAIHRGQRPQCQRRRVAIPARFQPAPQCAGLRHRTAACKAVRTGRAAPAVRGVPAGFGDAPILYHDDAVGLLHRGQAMRDHQRRAAAAQCRDGILHMPLGFGIQLRGGLIPAPGPVRP